MKEIPLYIKDTNYFINKINNHNIPKESIFVTLDVKSLYTSIPNPEGIAAVKKAHERYQRKTVPTKVITTFVALILTLNLFFTSNKRVCNGYYLCPILFKYLYRLLRREIHLPIN